MPTVDFVKTHQPRMLVTAVIVGLLGMCFFPSTNTPVMASDDAAIWAEVSLPAQGINGGWVLAEGSDIQYLTASPDGALYAIGKGLTDTLYRSGDNGASWSSVGKVTDDIVAVAFSPGNSGAVYYTTPSQV